MEISTEENERLLSQTYEKVMGKVHAGEEVSDEEDYIFQVELLSQEVNSGISFEQYFRWVGKSELDKIISHIEKLELPDVVGIVEEAIKVAFPEGIPEDDDEYEECTEWDENQEERLAKLFELFEEYNGAITNKLGAFIKENNLV